jgi:hypothetical protein
MRFGGTYFFHRVQRRLGMLHTKGVLQAVALQADGVGDIQPLFLRSGGALIIAYCCGGMTLLFL